MKTMFLVFLFAIVIRPTCSDDPVNSSIFPADEDFSSQFQRFGTVDRCVDNCTIYHREEPHVITKRATGDFFDVISSALSSLMNYVYRIFLQPWIAVIETLDSSGSSADNSSTMDKSFYTVEGRSAIDPSSKPVKWREVGTAIFEVISKLT